MHAVERLRERLLAEPAALDELAAAHPGLDRPRFRALIAKARDERSRGAPPHAYRELYRDLKALDDE
jgi:ribosome-associated protein